MKATSEPFPAAQEVPAAGALPKGGGTILDAIGNTPLVMVDGIWAKLEFAADILTAIERHDL